SVTLSDGKSQGERAPRLRSARPGDRLGRSSKAHENECSVTFASEAGSGAGRLLVYRRLVDLLDRRLELGVELLVGLVFGQPFEKRAREAGDEGGIACQPGAGLVTAVAARQGDDPQDARVRRQVAVQARPGRNGDLQHHGRALSQRLDVL